MNQSGLGATIDVSVTRGWLEVVVKVKVAEGVGPPPKPRLSTAW